MQERKKEKSEDFLDFDEITKLCDVPKQTEQWDLN